MAKLTIEGLVMETYEEQRGKHPVRTVIVREPTDGKFPSEVAVEFFGDKKADEAAKCKAGFQVKIAADLSSRYWNPDDGRKGRWFTSCSGWRVEVVKAGGSVDDEAEESVHGSDDAPF